MPDCQTEQFGFVTDHRWHYDRLPRGGEPCRQCRRCLRVEVYYVDDLLAEQE